MSPRGFRIPARFRAWLARNHDKARALEVLCYKTRSAARGMSYSQALDEALCFGWIDGVRHGVDADSFAVRFTPRGPRSIWSRVNIARVEALIRAGRMAAPGLARFRARDEARTGLYSFERGAMRLSPAFERRFRTQRRAWAHFRARPPWYRRTSIFWVMSAKREETRTRRLATLIDCSARGRSLPSLERG